MSHAIRRLRSCFHSIFFSGLKTYPENFIFDNMTEHCEATAVFCSMGKNVPPAWGVPWRMVLDVPVSHRSIVHYRTTLGHKVNCRQRLTTQQ